MKKILIVPDSHARPNQDNKRFDALGQFIVDKEPDIVVSIGDWADMGSLCVHDKATLASEGRRYVEDVASSIDALERTMLPVRKHWGTKRKKRPDFYITLGNHEERINRAANALPELFGKLSVADLCFEKAGWTVVPFLKPLVLEGICFQHYFTSGIMGKPIGGVNHARTLVVKNFQSSVCGHSHARDYYEDVRADGQRVFGLVVGCFDKGDHFYTTEQRRWWSGLVMLHECQDGHAEPAFFSTNYVMDKYT